MGERFDVKKYPIFSVISIAFFVYLYLPLIIVVLYSFNANHIAGIWTGFSLRWYGSAVSNTGLTAALQTSLAVAGVATVAATAIALAAALAVVRGRNVRFRRISAVLISLPLLLPEIVLAVATLILFSLIEMQNGLLRLMIAHTAFCAPFAFLPIRARLQGVPPDLEEAAADLYASPWRAFRRVTLPLLLPGVFAGAMLAFLISMDDFIASNILASGGVATLPVYIFSLIRVGASPELNAIAALLIAASATLAAVVLTIVFRAARNFS